MKPFGRYFDNIPKINIRPVSKLTSYSHVNPKELGKFIQRSTYIFKSIQECTNPESATLMFNREGTSWTTLDEMMTDTKCKDLEDFTDSFDNFVVQTLTGEPISYMDSDIMDFKDIIAQYNSNRKFSQLRTELKKLPTPTEVIIGNGTTDNLIQFMTEFWQGNFPNKVKQSAKHEGEHQQFMTEASKAIGREDLKPYIGLTLRFQSELIITPCCWNCDFYDGIILGNISENQFNIYRKIAGQNPEFPSPSDAEILPHIKRRIT